MSGNRKRLLLIDNFDSFTYILQHYFLANSFIVDVVRNDFNPLNLRTENYDGFVISPGPGRPEQSGHLLTYLELFENTMPLLGICLGMQALGVKDHLELSHATQPFHGKKTTITHNGHSMFDRVPVAFEVGRYHSLVLKNVENHHNWELTAVSSEGEAMAMAHIQKPIWGVQFHPESCMTPHGLNIIENWCKIL